MSAGDALRNIRLEQARAHARKAQAGIGTSLLILVAWEPGKMPMVVGVGRKSPEDDRRAEEAVPYVLAAMIECAAEEELHV